MRAGIILLLLLFANLTWAQEADSVYAEYTYDTTDESESYYEKDDNNTYATSTYTRKPGELTAVSDEQQKTYRHQKFSKTEWKKIVGNTRYNEDEIPEKQVELSKNLSPAWDPAILKLIAYGVIIALIVVALIYIIKNTQANIPISKKNALDPLLQGDHHIEDLTETDLDSLLQQALAKNDFRAAVRLYYIKLLKHLHVSGHIHWKKDKTNRDYASELTTTPFVRKFKKLMTAYEITWYGERTPSAHEFELLQADFKNIHHQSINPTV